MIAIVLTLLVAAGDGQVAIVERSTLGVSPAIAVELRERLVIALQKVHLEAVLSKASCADRPCLMALAQERGGVVVGVTVVKNRKGLTVDLEAVDGEVVVLQQTFMLSSENLERSPEAQAFAHQLGARVVKDRPVVPAPEPEVKLQVETRPEWLEPAPVPLAPKALGGVAAGVGLVGIGLLIAGAAVKGGLDTALDERPVVTTLSRAQAHQQADLANGLLGAGSAAFGLGLAGGVTALVMGLSAH